MCKLDNNCKNKTLQLSFLTGSMENCIFQKSVSTQNCKIQGSVYANKTCTVESYCRLKMIYLHYLRLHNHVYFAFTWLRILNSFSKHVTVINYTYVQQIQNNYYMKKIFLNIALCHNRKVLTL